MIDVSAWLQSKGVTLRERDNRMLHALMTEGDFTPLGMPTVTVRWRCNKKGLPSPRRWCQLGKGLRAARVIRQGAPLREAGERCGYADHTGVAHNLRRTFGVTATTIRKGSVTDADLMERWWSKYVPTGTQERNAA